MAWITWDPDSIFFVIPYVQLPVTWYGALFAFGFFLAYHIFIHMFRIFLALSNELTTGDINFSAMEGKKKLQALKSKSASELREMLMTTLPDREKSLSGLQKRLLKIAETWRGSAQKEALSHRMQWESVYPEVFIPLAERAKLFAEKGLLYIIIATVLGARLGHILFYENPVEYLKNPLAILKTWEGGLASHGGIAAILLAVWIFTRKTQKIYPEFTFVKFMDFIAIPILFVCGMIRIGNFFNQEILGTESTSAWAVVFQHPADGSMPLPRHPVQLYESAFYFFWFAALYILWRRGQEKLGLGKITGLAIAGSFAFRFFIEYVKLEQSVWMPDFSSSLLMGQVLSVPMVIIGLLFYFYRPIFAGRKKHI